MELKLGEEPVTDNSELPLIEPYGIETASAEWNAFNNNYPLIEPYGIETTHTRMRKCIKQRL